MRNMFMVILLMVPTLSLAQVAPVAQEARAQEIIQHSQGLVNQVIGSEGVLIKKIVISGLALRDKQRLEKIIKSNRKKRLSVEQIQQMVEDVKILYLEAGYSGLVDVNYKIKKTVLTINVMLLSR